jgi:prepilin-type N-terminal cleavage/methylation domain-containing protein
LATGCNKNNKGFTLLELLVVLLIIGIASSVILINTSSVNQIIKGQMSVEKNFQLMSEESILSSKILGWFPGKSSQKIYILDTTGNKSSEFNSDSLDSYWNSIAEYKKKNYKRQRWRRDRIRIRLNRISSNNLLSLRRKFRC